MITTLRKYHQKRIGNPQYKVLADAICTIHPDPLNIIDIGCSVGELLLNFPVSSEHGEEVYKAGIDISPDVMPILKERGIDAHCIDLDKWKGLRPKGLFDVDSFDLICCMELPEHIRKPHNLLEFVNAHAQASFHTLVWSAAPPGQRGKGHVNCQPHDYWEELLGVYGGWKFDQAATDIFQDCIAGKTSTAYHNTDIYRITP